MKYTIPKFELIRLLLRHRKLADNRSLSAMENKVAKFFIYLSMLILVIYLMGLAILFSQLTNSDNTTTATENLFIVMPFLLLVDFGMRFTMQQTPAHIIKPYILLPLPRYTCIDAFVYNSLISKGNFIWFAFLLPYALMSIVFSYGLATAMQTMLLCLVLILINSQWYAIARTLIKQTELWWALPIIIYGIEAMPLYVGSNAGWTQFTDIYSYVGAMLDKHSVLPILFGIIALAAIVLINRRLQYASIEKELMRSEVKKSVKKVNKFAFFEKYGEIGLFMQLEMKLLLRNATPKKALKSGFFTMALLCAFIVLSDVYDSDGMTNFWGLYAFMIFGTMNLIGLMSYEGNYIDCLLTHRENILSLLKAKYIFYSLLLIAPFQVEIRAVPAYAARSDKRQVVVADARQLHDIHNGFPVLHRLSDSCIQQNNGSAEHQDDRQSRTENQLHSDCPGSYRVYRAEHSCKHTAVCILRERCLSDNAIYRTLFHCNTQIVAAQRLQPTDETQICKP